MGGESLRPYLKMQNLFVRDINKAVSPAVVRATLEKAAGPLCKVVIPLDFKTDQSTHIGQAYMNFASEAEAESCLERVRFKLVFGKQRAKVLYAPGGSQSDKDKVWGPYSYKFQIIVKNLSEEVETEAFYEFFSKFGEILQCKTDTDNYGQYYGQVQYMESGAVAAAVSAANGTRWMGAVIQVVAHHRAGQADSVPAPRVSVDAPSTSSFPSLASSAAAAAAPAPTNRPAVYTQHLQQQQQQQAVAVSAAPVAQPSPAPINFAVQALESSGGRGSGIILDSPVVPPLGLRGSSNDLHVGAPVVAPLALPVAAPVAAPIAAPVAVPVAAPAGPFDSPRLGGTEQFGGATTGPGSRAAAGGVGRLSLLDRIMANREAAAGGASAAAGSVAAAAAGTVGQDGSVQPQPGTPNGVIGSGRSNGNRKRGGLLKSLTQALDQVSELLCCPITHEVFKDPVVAADGITYERSAITGWLTTHDTSPMTNTPLPNCELHPNNLVRTLIEELL